MGGAWVWLEYMTFFAAHGIPCYAVSLRGHGVSYHPPFLRMVYGTTKRMLADDVLAALRWAQKREDGRQVVLVGHSSGGLSQFVLSERSAGVYISWAALDPWFSFRMIFHLWHPNSPLSHPGLTRQAFFSNDQTDAYVEAFQARINPYESFLWALGMMRPFVSAQNIINQITSWGRGQSILVMVGEADKLTTPSILGNLAKMYRQAFSTQVRQKRLDAEDTEVIPVPEEGEQDTTGHGVQFRVVPNAGHHLQNDVTWEVGARKLLAFYRQL
ncbi:hypothetical protein N0V88_000110 [Collariella sp. IMI 366227]|nr:hypothetical protein N0V88_000110 [Collariella sp. IMI 366227]